MIDMRRVLALLATAVLAGPVVADPNGETLFLDRCGACHLAEGMGTNTLIRRVGPERSLLAERHDLNAAYIELAVRQGVGRMPFLTRVDVTDEELAAIVDYLTRQR